MKSIVNIALVMTVIGQDRPGLIDSVAGIIVNHGGNWLESRMCHLGGQFAGILRVEVNEGQHRALVDALNTLESQGLRIVVVADRPPAPADEPRWSRLEIVGQDRPGIVRHITHVLACYGVNVEELHTECRSAPMSGETLFQAEARLQIPPTCHLADLRQDLEKIASDLIVDITLAELSTAPTPGATRS